MAKAVDTSYAHVLVDDKIRIRTAVKEVWGARPTTVFPRQVHYHATEVAWSPAPDATIAPIDELTLYDRPALPTAARPMSTR